MNFAIRYALLALVSGLIISTALPSMAVEGAAPAAPTEYKGREIAQTMHYLGAPWLTRESREREEDCKTLLAALKIKPGDTVCDLGCGNGFYSLKLAKLVGEQGRVIARRYSA